MKFKVSSKIERRGYPTSASNYKVAHSEADNAEKKKYPKGYRKLKVIDDKISINQLAGSHTRSGKVIVSRKVPRKLRPEVAYHERKELSAQRRLKQK